MARSMALGVVPARLGGVKRCFTGCEPPEDEVGAPYGAGSARGTLKVLATKGECLLFTAKHFRAPPRLSFSTRPLSAYAYAKGVISVFS